MKKKTILIILCVILISIIFSIIYLFRYPIFHLSYPFYEVAEVNGFIYEKQNNQYIKIGNLNANVELIESSSGYHLIKDTELYVSYKDIKKGNKNEKKERNYFKINDLKTNNSFDLYQNGHKIGTIQKEIILPYDRQDEKYYEVSYLGDIYQILKEQATIIEKENEYTNYIPVLNISDIKEENCYNECIRKTKIDEIIKYLKENEYQTINIDIYNEWINNKIVLPKKSILILSNDELEIETSKKDEKIIINNKASKVGESSSYLVNNNTNISDLKMMLDGIDIIDKKIDDTVYATSIPVLNYHFFYNENYEVCNETICLATSRFEKQLSYLKENGFKTLTMEEFRAWMYGEIELPNKSVLLTIDDGAFGTDTHLPELLNKYQINATLFLITAWWPKEKYVSPYLEIESHGYDIHTSGSCGKGKLLCLSKEEMISDLKKSIEILGSDLSFCYPFYANNDITREAVKEAGFKISFVGGSRNAKKTDDKYKIPRYPIYDNTSMESFISIVN